MTDVERALESALVPEDEENFKEAVRWVAEYYEIPLAGVWGMPIEEFSDKFETVLADMQRRRQDG